MSETTSAAPSYRPGDCCGSADCVYLGSATMGQCWGQVMVIDEMEIGTEGDDCHDWVWVHACEGHREVWGGYGPYKPEPVKP